MSDMPWPSIKSAGQIVSASADWNVLVEGLWWVGGTRPQCKVRRTTTQSIPDVTETFVNWDGELWDELGMHNTGSNTSRLYVLYPGRYRFEASIRTDTGTYDYYLQPHLNGSAVVDGLDTRKAGKAANVTDWGDQVFATLDCVVGDYWEVGFWHDKGSALNVRANSWASLEWVGHNL